MTISLDVELLAEYYDIRARAIRRRNEQAHQTQEAPIGDGHSEPWTITRNRLGDLRGLRVLEVGPGTGDFVRYALAQDASCVTVLDISETRLTHLRETLPSSDRIHYRLGDVCSGSTTKEDKGQDLIVAQEVVEHLASPFSFLKECHRLLKDSGRLYLSTPNLWTPELWFRNFGRWMDPRPPVGGNFLVRRVFDGLYEFLTECEIAWLEESLPNGFREHLQEFSAWGLRRLLTEAGYEAFLQWGTRPRSFRQGKPWAPLWPVGHPLTFWIGDNLRIIGKKVS